MVDKWDTCLVCEKDDPHPELSVRKGNALVGRLHEQCLEQAKVVTEKGREGLATEVQGLIGKCLQLEAECHRSEEVSAAETLQSGRAFLVVAARRLEGPMPWERPPT